jgi:Concanavalin A-like lectin/glucanases superfamily
MELLQYNNKILQKNQNTLYIDQNSLLKDLFSYWSYDANANDIHRKYNNTVVGATSGQTGILDDCYYFDGIDDTMELDINVIKQFPDGQPISLNVWLKSSDSDGQAWIIDYGCNATAVNDTRGFQLAKYTTWSRWFLGGGYLNELVPIISERIYAYMDNGVVFDGNWHMYTLTYDGGTPIAYKDGVNLESTVIYVNTSAGNLSISYNHPNIANFTIGYDTDRGGGLPERHYEGYFDEFGFWKRGLTSDEVKLLYNNGAGLAYNKYNYNFK